MSTPAPSTDPVSTPSGKKKKNNKKKNANKAKDVVPVDVAAPQRDTDEREDEPETPVEATSQPEEAAEQPVEATPKVNGHNDAQDGNGHANPPIAKPAVDAADTTNVQSTAAFDALARERDALKAEVEQLRKQLEAAPKPEANDQDTAQLRTELEAATSAKEHAEEQYEGLLERVNHLKSTLGERLKRDRAELEEAKERIEDLEAQIESQNAELQNGAKSSEGELAKLREELQDATREVTSLRSRSNLSQQNWVKERDEMAKLVSNLKQEVETTTNAMGEWEVIAMEERSVKESLVDKTAELEEQVATLRENYQEAAADRDKQSQAIDSLQKALSDIQEARKRELREMVETSEEQLQALKKLVQEADARAVEAETARESAAKELERTAPFEKEVKEKNLLIGKLRHEAIVLNDHLTKALRYLKKTKPEDNVDRQVVTNHLLHFLTLDRSDPKRFQILQVMAGYLDWTDEQREQAGLARPGTTSGSSLLRLPASPFHRTPSTPSLSAEFFTDTTSGTAANKESLADLWTGFLERQAQEALSPDADGSERKGSVSSAARSERGS
ncbi:hypothetical protein VD0002_g4735 [Verticillium dahliae]|uniref:GRIP domain-containing protein n=1 Tax=Verticillium dahliae TaxID=27337 RepID=A0AA44WTA1_VERDA|nr:Sterol uptake control protein 2 [Verticillium dahliae VDG2]PNH36769.1 hypothetical protein BJF96_g374 [Verticillium dahliae]PNH53006.1 hypothetical protein VD0003_g4349 [Verticillium dahliae]PNH63686.1 hypothetical protein VD0002_g4735 [Verticillium dahliae]